MSDQAYPLHWPAGWPRTKDTTRSKFVDRTVGAALNDLDRQ
jgi:hypothetical protein